MAVTAMGVEDILALPFVTLEERKSLPDCEGVYFAIINRESVAYIGSTGSLLERWRCHDKRRALLEMGEVSIAYVTTEPDDRRECIEQDGIEVLAPPLNRGPAIWGWRDRPGEWLPMVLGRPRKADRPPPPADA